MGRVKLNQILIPIILMPCIGVELWLECMGLCTRGSIEPFEIPWYGALYNRPIMPHIIIK
jgi:hypothetical protein